MPAWLRNVRVQFWVATAIYFCAVVAVWEWLDRVRPELWWLPPAVLLPISIGLATALLRWRRVD
jgi:CDP-diglyceride synthetase